MRQNVTKRLKARQKCVDDENAISKKLPLLIAQDTQQCTEHPTHIRGCVLVPRTQLVGRLRRMFFEWQGIIQVKPKRFSTRQFFFPFSVLCCFMAVLKCSADTNAGQICSSTHWTKNLHRSNLRLLISKRSLLFERQSLTNAISLPLIFSISSKHVFIAVSDFGARKKNHLKPVTSGPIFPTPPRQR